MIESVSSLFYLFSFFLSSTTSQSLNSCDGVTFLNIGHPANSVWH